ncbi:hypothetical protein GS480_21590, partial [Rhodococcus hoagii]|nr:hypothetical protein [Prescottella equi]
MRSWCRPRRLRGDGLSIAYGTYRARPPATYQCGVLPAPRRRSGGPIGRIIDVLAIFATMFGTAASLGLGALQIGSGLEVIGWMGEVGT